MDNHKNYIHIYINILRSNTYLLLANTFTIPSAPPDAK